MKLRDFKAHLKDRTQKMAQKLQHRCSAEVQRKIIQKIRDSIEPGTCKKYRVSQGEDDLKKVLFSYLRVPKTLDE